MGQSQPASSYRGMIMPRIGDDADAVIGRGVAFRRGGFGLRRPATTGTASRRSAAARVRRSFMASGAREMRRNGAELMVMPLSEEALVVSVAHKIRAAIGEDFRLAPIPTAREHRVGAGVPGRIEHGTRCGQLDGDELRGERARRPSRNASHSAARRTASPRSTA
jgi:hypothetical protein